MWTEFEQERMESSVFGSFKSVANFQDSFLCVSASGEVTLSAMHVVLHAIS